MKKLSILLICIMIIYAIPVNAFAAPQRDRQQKEARIAMRANLNDSNRLALEIGQLKIQNARIYELAKKQIKRAMKASDTLTGDQLVLLKDQLAQLKQIRDQVKIQNNNILDIRNRLRNQRVGGNLVDAVPMSEALVSAQEEMIETLKNTDAIIRAINDILTP